MKCYVHEKRKILPLHSYMFYASFSKETCGGPDLVWPQSTNLRYFEDCRGEIAQDRDRHGFPTNSRVQQEFIYFHYRRVSASFSGTYQVEGFLVEGCEIVCSNFGNSSRLWRELVRTGSQFFVDIFSWA